jgi:topoisomerase-4 subunit A
MVSEDNSEDEYREETINGEGETAADAHSDYKAPGKDKITYHLSGMYRSWFLDYSSYVILDRAVPHIDD